MGIWPLLVKFIVFFMIPIQWYCDLSVLTFSLINDINECLPGTQSELLHVKLFEWYKDYGSFFVWNDFNKQFLCQIQSYTMCPDNSNISCWLYTLVNKVTYFFSMEAHLWSHNPQKELISHCYQGDSNRILDFVSHPDFPLMETT